MSTVQPKLFLVTPPVGDADAFRPALQAACASDDVAAVLIRLLPGDERTLLARLKILVPVAQAHGAAAIVADPGGPVDVAALTVRSGADGAHARGPDGLRDLRDRLRDGQSVGVGGLGTKHDAMGAGEAGADYVMFGEQRPDGTYPSLDLVEERATWWAEIFQTPCVAVAPAMATMPVLAGTGAEFVAVGDPVWSWPGGPAAGVAAARDAMHRGGAA